MNTRHEKAPLRRLAVVAVMGTVGLFFASEALALEPLCDGFRSPVGIACDAHGAIYVTNWGGDSVERITRDGSRSVFADGIASPAGIAVNEAGNVYVSSTGIETGKTGQC